jgi:hypothetical protein
LKTLCCLRLKPESAMVAVVPVLHEIIPHGWARLALVAPDATITSTYAEHPSLGELLWASVGRCTGRGALESAYYREIEAPLDSCWLLGGMIGDGGRSIAFVNLSRPRSARPFTGDDVQRLDRLRPWLAHAFRRPLCGRCRQGSEKVSRICDDRTPRTCHSPCRTRAAGTRRHAGADKSRRSPCPWKTETYHRGRTRRPTHLDRGSYQKALSDSRCSQFYRASHENLAWPKTKRMAPKLAARRIARALALPGLCRENLSVHASS